MTTTIKTKKEIEVDLEISIPSFYKSGYTVMGILDTDSVFSIMNVDGFNAIHAGSIDKMGNELKTFAANGTEITEEEFFTEYNKAYESMRLQPKLETHDEKIYNY